MIGLCHHPCLRSSVNTEEAEVPRVREVLLSSLTVARVALSSVLTLWGSPWQGLGVGAGAQV